jgi:hypothetical protein
MLRDASTPRMDYPSASTVLLTFGCDTADVGPACHAGKAIGRSRVLRRADVAPVERGDSHHRQHDRGDKQGDIAPRLGRVGQRIAAQRPVPRGESEAVEGVAEWEQHAIR